MIFTDFCGSQRIYTDLPGFILIFIDLHRFVLIHRFTRILIDFCGFASIREVLGPDVYQNVAFHGGKK
jgi:hypothetical protein